MKGLFASSGDGRVSSFGRVFRFFFFFFAVRAERFPGGGWRKMGARE